jgi:hypothetical protein
MHSILWRKPCFGFALILLCLGLAGTASATHPRFGGGTPTRAALIPAFKECTNPNSVHAAPFVINSCTPPVLESSILTTSTVGAGAGFSAFKVFCTDGQSPPCTPNDGNDTEDVAVDASATDVRCAAITPHCTAVGADYTGKLIIDTTMRMTDHSNGLPVSLVCTNSVGNPPCVTATTTNFPFEITVQCVDNGGTNGGQCNLSSTLDVMYPQFVQEFQRRNFENLAPITMLDEGPDGLVDDSSRCPFHCTSGDETTFARQGWFTP